MKIFKNFGRAVSSLSLAAAVFASSLVFSVSAVSETAASATPDTQICSMDSFSEYKFNSSFKVWNGKKPTVAFENGALKLTPKDNSRNAAYMVQTESYNQYVSMETAPQDGQAVTPMIWLRAYEYDRTTPPADRIVPLGYIVKANFSNNKVHVQLFKSILNDSGTFVGDRLITEKRDIAMKINGGTELASLRLEATVSYDAAAQSNTLRVNIIRIGADGTVHPSGSLCVEDSESELLQPGWAGLSAQGSGEAISITSFAYHTSDGISCKTLYDSNSFDDFDSSFTPWQNNTYASVEDGRLIIAGNSNNTARDSAQFLKRTGENLKVSATVKTPHYYNGDEPVREWQMPVVWLKAVSYLRNGTTPTPVGYFISTVYSATSNTAQIRLYKQTYNDALVLQNAVCLADNPYNLDVKSGGGNYYLDITYDASVTFNPETQANDIIVKIYKGTTLMKTFSVSDGDSKLFGAGAAGLGANSASGEFTAFKVVSEDDAAPIFAYAEVNGARTNTLMAQSVSVDTSSVYRLSAMVSGDFTENPLCIAYQGADGKVAFSELTPTAAADIDPHYNRYTFNIDMSALGLTSDFIYVGVKMQETGAPASHLKFSEFEFRKVSDGAVGGNLLFNGDFRMGTCGWTASTQNIYPGSSMSVASAGKADSTEFLYDRFLYVCDTSYADYQRNFINTEYMGDVNEDTYFDIRDLVALKKKQASGEYAIFGDMDNSNVLEADDLAALRQLLLSDSKK